MNTETYQQDYRRSMVVSIIGRPNVGKSTIFNRLMRKAHKAITYDKPGVTRDRHYGITSFEELGASRRGEAILVDTGGFYPQKIDENVPKKRDQVMNKFFNIMTEQAKIAIRESDLILFVVDSREGILPFDQIIADYIRTQKKEFWIVINKYDSDKQEGEEFEFYSLGIDPDKMFKTSAEHGLGLLELKQELHRRILKFEESEHNEYSPLSKGVTPREKVAARLAIIGAPNAGKSTLLNLLLGSERALVSEIAGTTVDPIEGFFDLFFGKDAKRLETDVEFAKNDNLLLQQYEEFRVNNPDVYQALSNVYNIEEENTKGAPIYDEAPLVSDASETREEEDLNLADALSDEEFKKYDDELYEEVFNQDEFSDEEVIDSEIEEVAPIKEEGSHWRSIHIVDTAGIRRHKAIDGFIEQQSVYRALRCITESDIIIYMVDASIGISHQDRRLLDIALDKGKSVIVCLNKIDLIKEKLVDEKAKKEWLLDLRETIPWLSYCDLIPISAKHSKHIGKLKDSIKKTVLIRNTNIGTGKLNRYVYQMLEQHSIGIKKSGKRLKIKYASMLKADPPTFLMFSNLSQNIPDNYKTYLKNGLRKEFHLANTPIHLIFRTGEDLSKRFQKRLKEIE